MFKITKKKGKCRRTAVEILAYILNSKFPQKKQKEQVPTFVLGLTARGVDPGVGLVTTNIAVLVRHFIPHPISLWVAFLLVSMVCSLDPNGFPPTTRHVNVHFHGTWILIFVRFNFHNGQIGRWFVGGRGLCRLLLDLLALFRHFSCTKIIDFEFKFMKSLVKLTHTVTKEIFI